MTCNKQVTCAYSTSVDVDFNLTLATVGYSNLGGWEGSANPPALRINNIVNMSLVGGSVDLIVSNRTDYTVWNAANNKPNGKLGQINLEAPHSGGGLDERSSELTFSFVRTGTEEPVTLPRLRMSFHDVRLP
eukprot:345914-Prymnesium_polylepis.1